MLAKIFLKQAEELNPSVSHISSMVQSVVTNNSDAFFAQNFLSDTVWRFFCNFFNRVIQKRLAYTTKGGIFRYSHLRIFLHELGHLFIYGNFCRSIQDGEQVLIIPADGRDNLWRYSLLELHKNANNNYNHTNGCKFTIFLL